MTIPRNLRRAIDQVVASIFQNQGWEPVVTQLGTVTATITRARYRQIGKHVTAWAELLITGSGTISNVITVSVPVTMSYPSNYQPVGTWLVWDNNTAVLYSGVVAGASPTTVAFWTYNTQGFEGGAYALAANDRVGLLLDYEV